MSIPMHLNEKYIRINDSKTKFANYKRAHG